MRLFNELIKHRFYYARGPNFDSCNYHITTDIRYEKV